MRIDQFAAEKPGAIVKIENGEHAFVPHDLPPDWDLPGPLWPLIADARQQIGILDGIGRNLPNPTILLRPLTDREAIRSSNLEGTYATPKELLLFELEPRESEFPEDATNSQREILNYRKALHHGMNSDLPLSLRLMKEMHAILMQGVRGENKNPGSFRNLQVAIGANHRFVPPPPTEVMRCLGEMEKYMNAEASRFDSLVDCFLVHYQFETIHPFNDGNGRVGRLLLALMMQRRCGLTKPWLYLSEFFYRYKDEYIQNLFRVSVKNDWSSWVEFCLHATITQTKETIVRCERLLQIRERFNERLQSIRKGNVRLGQIVDDVFNSPFVRIADLQRRLGVTYPTAKADVLRLEDAGILAEVPDVFPKTHYAPEVFEIAYEQLATD